MAIHMGCQVPSAGSSEHSLRGTDSKRATVRSSPAASTPVCNDYRLSMYTESSQELFSFLHAYLCKQLSAVCEGRGELPEDSCSGHAGSMAHNPRYVGNMVWSSGRGQTGQVSL